jgi:hypothetical protein
MLRGNLTHHSNTEKTENYLWPLLKYGVMMNDGGMDKQKRWERNIGERKKGDKRIDKWQNRGEGTISMVKERWEGRDGGNKDEQIRYVKARGGKSREVGKYMKGIRETINKLLCHF